MTHDIKSVDILRTRMGVGYAAAVQALDETEGDLVRALAYLEQYQQASLAQLTEQVKEGVTRSLGGEILTGIRWRLQDRVLAESSVGLAGVTAVLVSLLSVLISSSAIDIIYTGGRGDGPAGS